MINRKYKSVANHEYSRLPYMTDDGYDDVQRSTSQKYIQDNYGKFDESENQQSYKNDDDYQALEYNYSLPQFDIDGNLSGSDIDFAATTDKKIDCDEYWNELFPGHPTGTGPFIPSSNELYNLGIYSKKCPVEYKRQVCCGRGLRIQGPVNGELCSEGNFSFNVGNKPKDCEYDFWARKGVMKSWGDYTAPYVTEDTEDTLGIYPWTGVSGIGDTNCLTWKVKIKVCEECKGVIGYTTLQMSVSGTQTLTVVGWKAGEVYSWETTSGSINPSTGNSVTYTAPSSNVNCANNPTITLTCRGNVVDTLEIAIRSATFDYNKAAFYVTQGGGPGTKIGDPNNPKGILRDCEYAIILVPVRCDGSIPIMWDMPVCGHDYTIPYLGSCPHCSIQKHYTDPLVSPCAPCWGVWCHYRVSNMEHAKGECASHGPVNTISPSYVGIPCNCTIGAVYDVRTAQQKADGCCPAGLL